MEIHDLFYNRKGILYIGFVYFSSPNPADSFLITLGKIIKSFDKLYIVFKCNVSLSIKYIIVGSGIGEWTMNNYDNFHAYSNQSAFVTYV